MQSGALRKSAAEQRRAGAAAMGGRGAPAATPASATAHSRRARRASMLSVRAEITEVGREPWQCWMDMDGAALPTRFRHLAPPRGCRGSWQGPERGPREVEVGARDSDLLQKSLYSPWFYAAATSAAEHPSEWSEHVLSVQHERPRRGPRPARARFRRARAGWGPPRGRRRAGRGAGARRPARGRGARGARGARGLLLRGVARPGWRGARCSCPRPCATSCAT
jgi:hypothetical protein